jgi:hypothetical protein
MIPFRHREGSIATGGSGRVGPQPTARRPNGSAVSTGPWPGDLRTETVAAGYFIAVGVWDEDGTTHLLRQLVTEDSLVRKAVVAVAPKG